jgi:hypothetical protein
LYYYSATFAALGQGEPEDTATMKIRYQVNGKWHVAYETDITVNDKNYWTHECKPPVPIGGWPLSGGPDPTPYRIELYEGKTLKKFTDFRVVGYKKKS